MKRAVKLALGLEVSNHAVALALLRQDKKGTHVVRAARKALKTPIQQNPRALKRAVGELRRACRVQGLPATCSLFSPRSLMQIVEIPFTVTGHKGQYIQKEIRHYVALANVTVVSDYRDLYASNNGERMLVVAGDSDCVTEVVNNCQQGGLDVDVVEPQLLAYVRALYHEKIAGHFGSIVLLVLVRDSKLLLAVLRERNIDFMRRQSIKDDPENPEAVLDQLISEIRIIMQYYELEVPDSTGHWEVTVIADDENTPLPDQAQAFLSGGLEQVPVEILTSENIRSALSVDIFEQVQAEQISVAAVGHALRNLSEEIVLPKINCLPALIKEIKEIKRSMLLTAIAAAGILLIMGLATLMLIRKGEEVRTFIAQEKPNSAVNKVIDMRGALEAEIEDVGKIPQRLKQILATQKSVDWVDVLTDIRKVIPKTVSITQFDTRNDFLVYIDGIALTMNDVTTFARQLSQSDYIDTADLVETGYKSGANGYHTYELKCQLKTQVGI